MLARGLLHKEEEVLNLTEPLIDLRVFSEVSGV